MSTKIYRFTAVCILSLFLITPHSLNAEPFLPTQTLTPINEIEPNNIFGTAQWLNTIGANSPVYGNIDIGGDIDWYYFSATAGQTYVIELYEVALALNGSGYACTSGFRTGVGIQIYSSGNAKITEQCNAVGFGNVHNSIQFVAGVTDNFYIRLVPNNNSAVGSYKLRILPSHTHPLASWDESTFEPNNRTVNAYPIGLGAHNALTSQIEERNSSYATNAVDVDWYRFEGVAGQTYVVEIYDVAIAMNSSGYNCNNSYRQGVSLAIYDPTITAVETVCGALGAGNVHNIAQWTATLDGIYYVRVLPNLDTVSGSYRIRVLPEHGASESTWNANTFEPNNRPINAYPIELGYQNALASQIETRNSSYATNYVDIDWYRFEGVAGVIYVVELFNVAIGMNENGYNCNGNYRQGVSLTIYDPTITAVQTECRAVGAGNVHNIATFEAGLNGTFYIRVLPNLSTVSGQYSIRVLPDFLSPLASWNNQTHEPNNRLANAYLLRQQGNTITSIIESRNSSYATAETDIDWYRFVAEAGTEYTFELFNVANSLKGGGGYYCNGNYNTGLGLRIADPSGTIVHSQCRANGEGNTHIRVKFTAGLDGFYYVLVIPNTHTTSGVYNLRVSTPKDNQIFLPFIRR